MAGEIYKSPEGQVTMFQKPPSVEELEAALGRGPTGAIQAATARGLDQIVYDTTPQLQTGGIQANPEALGVPQKIPNPFRPGNLSNQAAAEIVAAIMQLAATAPQHDSLIGRANLNQHNPGALRDVWREAQLAIKNSNPGVPYQFE